MKKLSYLIIIIAFFSCNTKSGNSFTVEGTVKNTEAKKVYLEENPSDGSNPTVVDSSIIDKIGGFTLHAASAQENLFSLRTDQSQFPFAVIVNDSKKITVNADLGNSDVSYTVKGSDASENLLDFNNKIRQQGQLMYSLAMQADSLAKQRSSVKDSAAKQLDSLRNVKTSEYESAVQNMKDYTTDFLNKTNSPVLIVYAYGIFQNISQQFGLHGFTSSETADIVNKAATKFPQSTALADWKKKLRPSKAPDFALPDTSGKKVALSSFKGKYVLLDFWASWCQPCREENPNVVAAYNQFKNKNFTILSVSLDQDKDAWLKAIHDDGLTWNHVSDLKHWDSEAANLYNVTGIPYNFLIDPNGNIIAEDLRGKDLVNELNKVLK